MVLVVVVFTVGGFITFPVAICLSSLKGRVTATVLADVVVLIAKEDEIDAVSLSVNVRSIIGLDKLECIEMLLVVPVLPITESVVISWLSSFIEEIVHSWIVVLLKSRNS